MSFQTPGFWLLNVRAAPGLFQREYLPYERDSVIADLPHPAYPMPGMVSLKLNDVIRQDSVEAKAIIVIMTSLILLPTELEPPRAWMLHSVNPISMYRYLLCQNRPDEVS